MNVRTEGFYRSQLPVELEHEIFQFAASSYPKCVPKLLLVARRVRIWLEPELYRVIRSGNGRVIPPLYTGEREDVLDFGRLRQYGRHVRHVLLQHRQSQEIGNVLKHCPKVYNLALWIIHGPREHLIPILEGLPLRILSFDPSYFFGGYDSGAIIPFDMPLFRNLTHLEIINVTGEWSRWKQLACLSKLTHLALAGDINQEFINHVLVECKALKILLKPYSNTNYFGAVDVPQKDDRVAFLKTVVDHFEHWERCARGEEDFWTNTRNLQAVSDEVSSETGSEDHPDTPPR